MTEAEWLVSDCPYSMFQFIRGRVSTRKLRLFACACCRLIWEWLPDERSRKAVEVAERYADGSAPKEEVSAAQGMAAMALQAMQEKYTPLEAVFFTGFKGLAGEKQAWEARFFLGAKQKEGAKAAKAVARPTDRVSTVAEEMGQAAGWALSAEAVGQTVQVIRRCRLQHSHLLRCIFGNPFHPVIIDPGVLIPKVVGLAHTIYEGRVFDRMSELGEALEQSGCTNTDILAHCRGPGPHVRGCWVVDLLLAKN
jgi:hypothetical protein